MNLYNNLQAFSDLAGLRESSSQKRATFSNGNSWSCIDITFASPLFTNSCENYIIDKCNSFGRRKQSQKVRKKAEASEGKTHTNLNESIEDVPEWMRNISIDLDTVETEEFIEAVETSPDIWEAQDMETLFQSESREKYAIKYRVPQC